MLRIWGSELAPWTAGKGNTKKTMEENGIAWFQDFHPYLYEKDGVTVAFFGLQNSVLYSKQAKFYEAIRKALERTADAIAASGKVVEVNTGGMSRGWLDDAYPSAAFRALLRARGVRFVLSSDAHSADALDFAFDRFGDAERYADSIFG